MDFFAAQDSARKNTIVLIVLFVIAVLLMIIGLYPIMLMLIHVAFQDRQKPVDIPVFDPIALVLAVILIAVVVGSGSAYKIIQLRGGGRSVADMLGGRLLPPNSHDPAEKRVLNIVEEMALAAGAPVPPVYVIDHEPGINAFAAGYSIDDAVIGVNRGTIELLSRDELQGVIAHEFSHILNGDMRMNIRMIGVLHGILMLALIGYFLLHGSAYSRSSRNGSGGILALALGLLVLGGVGLIFGRIIKACVSRQREYLADASAVQFTRNPDGIGGALKMIGAHAEGSRMDTGNAEFASHMFFGDIFGARMSSVFATHPPLVKRIQKIDPQFNGDFAEYKRTRPKSTVLQDRQSATKKPPLAGTDGFKLGGVMFPQTGGGRFPIDPAIVVAGVGLPSQQDVEYSHAIVESIPETISAAAHDLYAARCLVFASLINRQEQSIIDQQWSAIQQLEGDGTVTETEKLLGDVQQLPKVFRLPVFEIVQGTLVGMSLPQYETFSKTVGELITADGKVSLFEFFLQHHLLIHLDRHFAIRHETAPRIKSIYVLQNDISLVIGVLARSGHDSEVEASAAFANAMAALGQPWGEIEQYRALKMSNQALADALDRLAQSSAMIRKQVLIAAATAIVNDGKVTVEEAELFRAIAESIDCPVPPAVSRQLQSFPVTAE